MPVAVGAVTGLLRCLHTCWFVWLLCRFLRTRCGCSQENGKNCSGNKEHTDFPIAHVSPPKRCFARCLMHQVGQPPVPCGGCKRMNCRHLGELLLAAVERSWLTVGNSPQLAVRRCR